MEYYLAPLEGITTYTYRKNFYKHYGGASRYFTPFIGNSNLSSRERNDILPEHNEGMHTIPQILTNRVDEFLSIADTLGSYGYDTVNLNLGCPSGTVVSRNRGAGFLSVPDLLDAFLEEIFDKCHLKISIKTRIGMHSPEEWDNLLAIYSKYPLEELIIHPRLQEQIYGGTVHMEAYKTALAAIACPICYNGDLRTTSDVAKLLADAPTTDHIMFGRGVLRSPGLMAVLSGEAEQSLLYDADRLHAFLDDILEGYASIMSGDTNTLFKMKDLWTFLAPSFPDGTKQIKHIKKATRISEYRVAVNTLFKECEFRPE